MKNKSILLGLIVLISCGRQPENRLEVLTCNDSACKSVIYDIMISKHNIQLNEAIYSKEEMIKYCISTDTQCGAYLYYFLDQLIQSDSSKFFYLKDKYRLENEDTFFEYLTESTYDSTLEKISVIEQDLRNICGCN